MSKKKKQIFKLTAGIIRGKLTLLAFILFTKKMKKNLRSFKPRHIF